MAEQVTKDPIVINEEEKRIQHYSSLHQILLVGDGDFSFSLCLAHSFASASNIVASSLQSYDEVIKMYKDGELNIEKLKSLGGTVLHGVDATEIQNHSNLTNRKFDRIIFNFPHAGFYGVSERDERVIQKHQNLVTSFFGSAKNMLLVDGQIHVTHKTTDTYNLWDIVGLASKNSLFCIECPNFRSKDYPGYNNKMGAGPRCDEPFPLGECQTFMFILDLRKNVPMKKQKKRNLNEPSQKFHKVPKRNIHASPQKFQKVPNFISPPTYFQQQQSWIDSRNSPTYVNDMNGFPSYTGLPARHEPRSYCFRMFNPYFSYDQEWFGRREDTSVEVRVCQALHHTSLMYRAETGRPLKLT